MIVNQTPVLVPVLVYITLLDQNWVIMYKQWFPVDLATMISLIQALYLTRYSSAMLLICLFSLLFQSFISMSWTVVLC